MVFFLISFIAGVLTVLAPCVLPVLPVILVSSVSDQRRSKPFVVVGALALSVILFTYLLKVSSIFVTIPAFVWGIFSGGVLFVFGVTLLFPDLWERVPGLARLSSSSNMLLGKGALRKGFLGDVIVGAALGPVFSTCSPTYFVILASVLPSSFALGTLYLLAYVLGFSSVLLFIALFGQRFADRLSWFADPQRPARRFLGVLFILLGIFIASGEEKKLEVAIISSGIFDVTRVEQSLLAWNQGVAPSAYGPYKEIAQPSGFINVPKITIGELIGKKVILVDFMTYSCVNCERTFPYLVAWYEEYKEQGLEIVGIHTPEFAFEKDRTNVAEAMRSFGITYPVVMDNDFATWNAYGNHYWPQKYLIDIHGNIVYEHSGEGEYSETESKIRELLMERAQFLDEPNIPASDVLVSTHITTPANESRSPETYFGSARNKNMATVMSGEFGAIQFSVPSSLLPNTVYLDGAWKVFPQYVELQQKGSVVYLYSARDVFVVAAAPVPVDVEVWLDGKLIETVVVSESKLYPIVRGVEGGVHKLELRAASSGLRFYAFTFG